MRIGVLASGSGTILASLVERDLPIVAVIVDRPCTAVERAEAAGIPAVVHERRSFGKDFDRVGYTAELVELLQKFDVELVVIAGFGTVMGAPIFEAFDNRILNTHPALLPSFPGWHGVADTLAAGVKITGCTVHIAIEEFDAGPILAQEAVPVLPDDTADTLHERIKTVERRLFPDTIEAFIASGGSLS